MIFAIVINVVMILLIGAACYGGARLGVRHGAGMNEIKIIETIEDREGNLHYTIEIGKHRNKFFWKLDAHRHGASAVTGAITAGPMEIDVLGVDQENVVIGERGMGGPTASRRAANCSRRMASWDDRTCTATMTT